MMDRIKLGLVGLNFGAYMAKREISDGGPGGDYVQITGACDLDRSRSERFGKEHRITVYADLDEMLSDPDIEAIGLFTPPAGRAELVRTCIRAGKAVMTTKPFELDPAAALTVLREARQAGCVVHLNSPGPLPAGDVAKINEWHETYALGRPIAVRWETYARYREAADGSWLDSPEKCPVAPIFRLGIYGINELVELLGDVDSVQVTSSQIFTGRPTPDNAELNLRFANGAIGSVFASLCIGDGLPYPAGLILHYENGTIIKRQLRSRNTKCNSLELKLNCIHDGQFVEDSVELDPEQRSGAYQWRNFYEAVRKGQPLDGEIAPETVATAIAVIAAMRRAEISGASEKVRIQ